LIYSTIGFAMWGAAIAAAAGSPWGIAATIAIVALVAYAIVRKRRRKSIGGADEVVTSPGTLASAGQ
nr:hypothetical protein [Actinomycetales bacterium]